MKRNKRKLSRQRIWQLKQQKSGKCRTCGKKTASGVRCDLHKREHAARMKAYRFGRVAGGQ